MGIVNIYTPTVQLDGEYQSDSKKEKCPAKGTEHKMNCKLEEGENDCSFTYGCY